MCVCGGDHYVILSGPSSAIPHLPLFEQFAALSYLRKPSYSEGTRVHLIDLLMGLTKFGIFF